MSYLRGETGRHAVASNSRSPSACADSEPCRSRDQQGLSEAAPAVKAPSRRRVFERIVRVHPRCAPGAPASTPSSPITAPLLASHTRSMRLPLPAAHRARRCPCACRRLAGRVALPPERHLRLHRSPPLLRACTLPHGSRQPAEPAHVLYGCQRVHPVHGLAAEFASPGPSGCRPFWAGTSRVQMGADGPKAGCAGGARTRNFALLSLRLPCPGPHMPTLTCTSALAGLGTSLAAAASGAADRPGSRGVRAARWPAAAAHRAATRRPRARFCRFVGGSGPLR